MFGNVKITKNVDPNKYSYSGYGIEFDSCSILSTPNFNWGKNVIICAVDMSSSVHVRNKNKDILTLGKRQTQRLDNTTLTTEAEYSIILLRSQRKFWWSLHYSGSNSFLFVNATKIYQFKAKVPEIKIYLLCLGNIFIEFTVDNLKNTGLNRHVYGLSLDYNAIATDDILDIHKYLMKNHNIK